MIWSLLLPVGLTAGTLAGMMGVGGGILLVPLFLEFFHTLAPDQNVAAMTLGTSHTVMCVASAVAVRTQLRYDSIDAGIVLRLGAGALAGVAIGSSLAVYVGDKVLPTLLSIFLFFMSWRMARGARHHIKISEKQLPAPLQVAAGLGMGTFASFLGVGGGILAVPLLIKFMGKKPHQAMAISSAFITVMTFCSSLSYMVLGRGVEMTGFNIGYVNVSAAAIAGTGALIGATMGVKLARRLRAERLMQVFAFVIAVVAVRMAYKGIVVLWN